MSVACDMNVTCEQGSVPAREQFTGCCPGVSPERVRGIEPDVVIRLSGPVVRALLAVRHPQPGLTTTDVMLDAVDRAWPELDRVCPARPSAHLAAPPHIRHRRRGNPG